MQLWPSYFKHRKRIHVSRWALEYASPYSALCKKKNHRERRWKRFLSWISLASCVKKILKILIYWLWYFLRCDRISNYDELHGVDYRIWDKNEKECLLVGHKWWSAFLQTLEVTGKMIMIVIMIEKYDDASSQTKWRSEDELISILEAAMDEMDT